MGEGGGGGCGEADCGDGEVGILGGGVVGRDGGGGKGDLYICRLELY